MKTLKGLFLVVGLVVFFALPCYTGEYTIFGPSRHERGTGKPVTESRAFTSPVTGADFTLKIRNGDPQGSNRVSSAAITLNGSRIAGPSDFNQQVGLIERKVSLSPSNNFSVLLNSAPGSSLDLTIIGVDNVPPQISITGPQNGSTTKAEKITVSGTVKDETPVTVTVNGIPAAVNGGSFVAADVPLKIGDNTITVTATDLGRNVSTSAVIVARADITPPQVNITDPQNGNTTKAENITITGTVKDESPVTVTVDGIPAIVSGESFVVADVPLKIGNNTITVTATDLWKNVSTTAVTVIREDITPPQISITDPQNGSTTEAEKISISGSVKDETPVTITVNGVPALVSGETFIVADVPLEVGDNTITATATDLGQNVSTASVTITRTIPRPRVEPQPQGSFGAQYEDLIPSDATATSYNPKRFSLVTGVVKDTGGAPIQGVTVSVGAGSCVECHGQKYGTVKTDAEGRFTIPVEGGGSLAVVYRKEGLITSHRQVYVPWNDIAVAETVQMLPYDTASTTFTFDGNPQTVMVHKSTPISDQFGSRSVTMVFTGNNMAYEMGTLRELGTVTTRATEFTTPESMPAGLPPTSAYTYCTELSVDGVARVRFLKPVTVWVNNFLGFKVGSVVPVGYYDREQGVWVPSDNGAVVRLLDTNGDGLVDALDATGDNLPDDLNGNGSFSDEVKGLTDPAQYPQNATFWRFSVTHFTPWDANWPYGPPSDAIAPNPEGEPDVDQQLNEEDDCRSAINSTVEDRSRIFHEDIPIPGTDMTMHYASNRVKGYKTLITVPGSGATVPASLKNIIVKVAVAGRVFQTTLTPLPNQKADFAWDGLDHLGREVFGPTTAQISVGFVYQAVYYGPGNFAQAFSQAGRDVTGIMGRQEVISWKRMAKTINVAFGGKGADLLAEGWSLSDHHYLSPKEPGTLFKGDGKTTQNSGTSIIITTVAGDGNWGYGGDGGPAVRAGLYYPAGIAGDAAGNQYIADTYNQRVRKVDAAGIITTVAGRGYAGYGGDGGPAVRAGLYYPFGVAADAAGNLYIADTYNHRVRKVDTAGIITTVAGRGYAGYDGDGGPAVHARLGAPFGVATDAAGNLYIADYGNSRVRKVDVAGIITTVAGIGSYFYGGDGGPAVQAGLYCPISVAVDVAGNLYIADASNNRVRKVDAAGIITTVAGNGNSDNGGDGGPAVQAGLDWPHGVAVDANGNLYIADGTSRVREVNTAGIITTVAGNVDWGYGGDGGPAAQAKLSTPWGVAVDAAGDLYITDIYNNRVRKVAPVGAFVKAGTSAGDIYFTEENGMGHILSSAGLHKRTIDLDTGVTLRTFGYDANDRLITITDQFGNVTTINRDAGGAPTSIVSPDGLTSRLAIGSGNHLTSVTYPDGSSYSFEYTPDGLMTAEIDPKGNRFVHQFDAGGKITDVLDPEGGHWNYSRATLSNGAILVQKTTGEGNTTTYLDRTDSTGAYTTTITSPNGGVATFSRTADSLTETKSLSCGMNVVSKYNLDPEYKFKYVQEQSETTPAGKNRLTLWGKTYQDTNGDKVPDLITDKITLNGKISTFVTNTLGTTKVATSPLGRKVTAIYDPATLLTSRISVPGLFDRNYGYDGKGRLTSVSRNTRQATFQYNAQGFLSSVTDPQNAATSYEYDAVGRVTGIRRPDGSVISFTYDNNGNMTVLTNPLTVNHGFTYNGVDLKTAYQTPLSGSYRYVYDKDRRLTLIAFPSGRIISNLYDKARLAQIATPEGAIDFNYLCDTKVGSITKGSEQITFGYDGPLVTSEAVSGTLSQTLSYAYNNDFNLSSFTYAGGTASYTYDNDGLLTGTGGFTITRNTANGLPESVSNSTFRLARSFSGYGEVDGESSTVGAVSIGSYSVVRDNAGRIIAKTETSGGVPVSYAYTYDPMGRLLTVTKDGALVEEYRYNANGSRIYEMNAYKGIAGRTLSYSTEDHLLTTGDTAYQYDLDGFLTTRTRGAEVTRYNYSSRGELLNVTFPDGKLIEYAHDPQGRPIAKKVNGLVVEKYLWQGLTRLLAVYDGSNNLAVRFQYADDRLPVAMTKGGATYYLAYDQVGSLKAVTDASGNIVKKIDYDTFGNILSDTNPTFAVPLGFAGGLHDRDTGLVRFGYRDYMPETGRWAAKDPIGFDGGDVDLFGYVQNNPVNYVDPFGLASFQLPPPGPPGSGCGDAKTDCIVPDLYPEACKAHDKCYSTPGKTRAQCDNEFWLNMVIESGPWPNVFGPTFYWTAVRIWGRTAFERAQGAQR